MKHTGVHSIPCLEKILLQRRGGEEPLPLCASAPTYRLYGSLYVCRLQGCRLICLYTIKTVTTVAFLTPSYVRSELTLLL